MQLHILAQASLKARLFPTWISLPEVTGHSKPLPKKKGQHEYHSWRLSWLCDLFSKSKASKLADHRPYDSKSLWMKALSPPYSLIYSLSQEELATLHKFIDENLAIGNPSSCSPLGALVLFIQKKDSSLDLHQISRPQPNFQEKLIHTSTHLQPSRCTMKAWVYTRSSLHATPCMDFNLETNGRQHSKPHYG